MRGKPPQLKGVKGLPHLLGIQHFHSWPTSNHGLLPHLICTRPSLVPCSHSLLEGPRQRDLAHNSVLLKLSDGLSMRCGNPHQHEAPCQGENTPKPAQRTFLCEQTGINLLIPKARNTHFRTKHGHHLFRKDIRTKVHHIAPRCRENAGWNATGRPQTTESLSCSRFFSNF